MTMHIYPQRILCLLATMLALLTTACIAPVALSDEPPEVDTQPSMTNPIPTVEPGPPPGPEDPADEPTTQPEPNPEPGPDPDPELDPDPDLDPDPEPDPDPDPDPIAGETCNSLLVCLVGCPNGDDRCKQECLDNTSRASLEVYLTARHCVVAAGCEPRDENCLRENCEGQMVACVDDGCPSAPPWSDPSPVPSEAGLWRDCSYSRLRQQPDDLQTLSVF